MWPAPTKWVVCRHFWYDAIASTSQKSAKLSILSFRQNSTLWGLYYSLHCWSCSVNERAKKHLKSNICKQCHWRSCYKYPKSAGGGYLITHFSLVIQESTVVRVKACWVSPESMESQVSIFSTCIAVEPSTMHRDPPKSSCFHVVDWLKIEIPFSVLIINVTSRASWWIRSTDWLCVKQPRNYVEDTPCLKCWQHFDRTVLESLLVCHSMTVEPLCEVWKRKEQRVPPESVSS